MPAPRVVRWAAVWPRSRWAPSAVLMLYLGLGLLWLFEVPLGEGPDEPAHVAYAFFLAREGRLPAPGDEQTMQFLAGESHQPPLAYALMQPLVAALPPEKLVVPLYGNPYFRWSGGEAANAYLHPLMEQTEWRDTFARWRVLRLQSVMLGAVSVALCYITARLVWPGDAWLALGAMALVAFNPQWIFHHALVSNDPLLITLGSLLITLSVAIARQEDEDMGGGRAWWQRFIRHPWAMPLACGLILGCMLLTKQSGAALLPVPVLAIVLGTPRGRWLPGIALLLLAAGAIAGWWYARNWRLFGDPAGLAAFQTNFMDGTFDPANVAAWREGGWNLLQSSWGMFGWMTIALPEGYYTIIRTMLVIALIGIVASVGRRAWDGQAGTAAVLGMAALCMMAWVILFAVAARTVGWPGRYLFPAAPALAAGLVIGLTYALPRRAGVLALVLVSGVLTAALPPTVVRAAYRTPAVREVDAPREGPYARFDFGWKRAFELHDATLERRARTGETLSVGLTWRLVERVDRPWSVFVHVVDAQETVVAKIDALPLEGRLPTDGWAPGDWYRDQHEVSLVGVSPGSYRVWVGLFDPVRGDRLGVYDNRGVLRGDLVDLGVIQVEGD